MSQQVLPPDPTRAQIYQNSNFIATKVLLPDGSVVDGLPVDVQGSIINLSDLVPYPKDEADCSYDVNMNLSQVDFYYQGVKVATLVLSYVSAGSPVSYYISKIKRTFP
jgi:hypothetical protein